MDATDAFNLVVETARDRVRTSASADSDRVRLACDYVEYVEAKLAIEEMPLTFEQWQEFNALAAD